MKQFYLKERDALEHSRKNAGSKARNDVETILDKLGFEPVDVVIPYKKVDTISGAVKTTFFLFLAIFTLFLVIEIRILLGAIKKGPQTPNE